MKQPKLELITKYNNGAAGVGSACWIAMPSTVSHLYLVSSFCILSAETRRWELQFKIKTRISALSCLFTKAFCVSITSKCTRSLLQDRCGLSDNSPSSGLNHDPEVLAFLCSHSATYQSGLCWYVMGILLTPPLSFGKPTMHRNWNSAYSHLWEWKFHSRMSNTQVIA